MPNSTENIQPSEKLITSFSVDLLSEEFSAQDRLNQEFIKKQLQQVPYAFRVIVKNTYNRLWKLPKRGEFIANTYFRKLGKLCRNLHIDITWNESQLKLVAKSRADMCILPRTFVLLYLEYPLLVDDSVSFCLPQR